MSEKLRKVSAWGVELEESSRKYIIGKSCLKAIHDTSDMRDDGKFRNLPQLDKNTRA